MGGSCFATADLEASNAITAPLACPVPGCSGSKLQPVGGPPILGDWQECRLQEAAGQPALSAKPASVALILTNDLTESCLPGGAHDTSNASTAQHQCAIAMSTMLRSYGTCWLFEYAGRT